MIAFSGLHEPIHRCSVTNTIGITTHQTGTVMRGPITIIRAPSGTDPCFLGVCSGITGLNQIGAFALTPDLTTPSRVIAMGLEVHDTTPQLYKQGTIAIHPVPGQVQTDLGRFINGTFTDLANGQWYTMPHATLTAPLAMNYTTASAIPGFLEWEASKGAYVAGRMLTPAAPRHFWVKQYSNGLNKPSQLCAGYVPTGDKEGNENWCYPAEDFSGLANFLFAQQPGFDSGFQPFQIWLTGLGATSTFKVVLRTVVEYFPECSDGSTLQNAVVPTVFDPTCFLEYHRARSVLPVAVPVGMNAKGDWFRMVKQAFRIGLELASGLATGMGFPMIGKAATILTSSSGQLLKPTVNPPSPARPPPRNKPKKKKNKKKN